MGKKYRTGGPNLFFIEFIISLFFFLIVSTVCIRVFVHAHMVTRNAEALSFAQTAASSVAEIIEANEGDARTLPDLIPQIIKKEDTFLLSYDRNFNICGSEAAFYTLSVRPAGDERPYESLISVADSRQNVIYELSVRFYRPSSRKEVLS